MSILKHSTSALLVLSTILHTAATQQQSCTIDSLAGYNIPTSQLCTLATPYQCGATCFNPLSYTCVVNVTDIGSSYLRPVNGDGSGTSVSTGNNVSGTGITTEISSSTSTDICSLIYQEGSQDHSCNVLLSSGQTVLQCYNPLCYTCNGNALCPQNAPASCGASCYEPHQYTCINSRLQQIPGGTHQLQLPQICPGSGSIFAGMSTAVQVQTPYSSISSNQVSINSINSNCTVHSIAGYELPAASSCSSSTPYLCNGACFSPSQYTCMVNITMYNQSYLASIQHTQSTGTSSTQVGNTVISDSNICSEIYQEGTQDSSCNVLLSDNTIELQCYNPLCYTCHSTGQLCPASAPSACGAACYDLNQYACVDNTLEYIPGGVHRLSLPDICPGSISPLASTSASNTRTVTPNGTYTMPYTTPPTGQSVSTATSSSSSSSTNVNSSETGNTSNLPPPPSYQPIPTVPIAPPTIRPSTDKPLSGFGPTGPTITGPSFPTQQSGGTSSGQSPGTGTGTGSGSSTGTASKSTTFPVTTTAATTTTTNPATTSSTTTVKSTTLVPKLTTLSPTSSATTLDHTTSPTTTTSAPTTSTLPPTTRSNSAPTTPHTTTVPPTTTAIATSHISTTTPAPFVPSVNVILILSSGCTNYTQSSSTYLSNLFIALARLTGSSLLQYTATARCSQPQPVNNRYLLKAILTNTDQLTVNLTITPLTHPTNTSTIPTNIINTLVDQLNNKSSDLYTTSSPLSSIVSISYTVSTPVPTNIPPTPSPAPTTTVAPTNSAMLSSTAPATTTAPSSTAASTSLPSTPPTQSSLSTTVAPTTSLNTNNSNGSSIIVVPVQPFTIAPSTNATITSTTIPTTISLPFNSSKSPTTAMPTTLLPYTSIPITNSTNTTTGASTTSSTHLVPLTTALYANSPLQKQLQRRWDPTYRYQLISGVEVLGGIYVNSDDPLNSLVFNMAVFNNHGTAPISLLAYYMISNTLYDIQTLSDSAPYITIQPNTSYQSFFYPGAIADDNPAYCLDNTANMLIALIDSSTGGITSTTNIPDPTGYIAGCCLTNQELNSFGAVDPSGGFLHPPQLPRCPSANATSFSEHMQNRPLVPYVSATGLPRGNIPGNGTVDYATEHHTFQLNSYKQHGSQRHHFHTMTIIPNVTDGINTLLNPVMTQKQANTRQGTIDLTNIFNTILNAGMNKASSMPGTCTHINNHRGYCPSGALGVKAAGGLVQSMFNTSHHYTCYIV